MLGYFRINDPYRIVGLLILLTLVSLPMIIDPPPVSYPDLKAMLVGKKVSDGFPLYTFLIDSTAPLTGWFEALIRMIAGTSQTGRQVIAFILILAQSVYLGIIFIDKRVYPENSFVPCVLYGILFFASFDTFSLSGAMVGMFFLLFALNNILRELEFREESLEMVLRTGIYVAIASLFEWSYAVFLLAAMVMFSVFSRGPGRKIPLLLAGFLVPHLLLIAAYSLNGGASALWEYFYLENLRFHVDTYVGGSYMLFMGIIPGFFLLASLFILNRESRFTKYQSQVIQVMFFWMLFAFAQAFYNHSFRPHAFIALIPPFTFFITHFFLLVRRRTFSEIAFLVFVGALVGLSYSSRYGEDETFARLLVKGPEDPTLQNRRVLALGNDLKVYHDNDMASPFLDWELCEDVLSNPDYYENVIMVSRGLAQDPPDVILDSADLMKPFLSRIPDLRAKYRREGPRYVRVSN